MTSQGQTVATSEQADRPPVTPASLVKNMAGLVSPPGVHLKILELSRSARSSITEIGKLVAQDPNLTARLLKLVNSSYYGLSRKVDTVSRAITLIGFRELEHLVAAVSVVSSFSRISISLVNMDTFWRHSLYTALLARSLAQRCRIPDPDRLFFAGLLHDLGSLVMYHQLAKPMAELLLVAEGDEQALYHAEMEQFGFSHAEVGAEMMDTWNLPTRLRLAVVCHHAPETAGPAGKEAAVVCLAEAMSNRSQMGAFCEAPSAHTGFLDTAWELAGLSPDKIDEEALIGEAGLAFADMAAALTGAKR